MLFCYNYSINTEIKIISIVSLIINFYNFVYFIMLFINNSKDIEYIYELPNIIIILFIIGSILTIIHNIIYLIWTNNILIYPIIIMQFIAIVIYIILVMSIFVLMCVNFDVIFAIIYLLFCISICSMELCIFVIRWNNYHNNNEN